MIHPKTVHFRVRVGAAERTRTFDLLINSQLHYRAVQRRQTIVLSSFSFTRLFKFSRFQEESQQDKLLISSRPHLQICHQDFLESLYKHLIV